MKVEFEVIVNDGEDKDAVIDSIIGANPHRLRAVEKVAPEPVEKPAKAPKQKDKEPSTIKGSPLKLGSK